MSRKLQIPLYSKLELDKYELARAIHGVTDSEWDDMREENKLYPIKAAERTLDYILAKLEGRVYVP